MKYKQKHRKYLERTAAKLETLDWFAIVDSGKDVCFCDEKYRPTGNNNLP